MNDVDVNKLMKLLSISREKAIELISTGKVDLSILNGYDLIGREVSRIVTKFKPEFDKLSDKIIKIKEDLVDVSVQGREKSQDSVDQ